MFPLIQYRTGNKDDAHHAAPPKRFCVSPRAILKCWLDSLPEMPSSAIQQVHPPYGSSARAATSSGVVGRGERTTGSPVTGLISQGGGTASPTRARDLKMIDP